jgi:hypothetical protein
MTRIVLGGNDDQPCDDDRYHDLFRSSLEAIINHRCPQVRLAMEISWGFLARFGSVCRWDQGSHLCQRPVAGLFFLNA